MFPKPTETRIIYKSLLHKILRNSYDRRYDSKTSRWIEVAEGYIEESIKNKAKNITRGF